MPGQLEDWSIPRTGESWEDFDEDGLRMRTQGQVCGVVSMGDVSGQSGDSQKRVGGELTIDS